MHCAYCRNRDSLSQCTTQQSAISVPAGRHRTSPRSFSCTYIYIYMKRYINIGFVRAAQMPCVETSIPFPPNTIDGHKRDSTIYIYIYIHVYSYLYISSIILVWIKYILPWCPRCFPRPPPQNKLPCVYSMLDPLGTLTFHRCPPGWMYK